MLFGSSAPHRVIEVEDKGVPGPSAFPTAAAQLALPPVLALPEFHDDLG